MVNGHSKGVPMTTMMHHQHPHSNVHPSASYISTDNHLHHHPNANYSPHPQSPYQYSPNRQPQRQGLGISAQGPGLAKIEPTDVQVRMLWE